MVLMIIHVHVQSIVLYIVLLLHCMCVKPSQTVKQDSEEKLKSEVLYIMYYTCTCI